MSDIKHTPGPWRAERHGSIMATVDGARRQVALATGDPSPVSEPDSAVAIRDANALLIAAAPDLLEVCRVALETLKLHDDDCGGYFGPAIKQLETVIQQAEGKR
jgi:hypothetical protein